MVTRLTQHFFIATRLPSLNDMLAWARQGRGKSNKWALNKIAYEHLIRIDIRLAKIQAIPGPVIIAYHWLEPNARRDYDNICAGGRKLINDALVTAKILKTDSSKQVIGFRDTWDIDPKRPGVFVQLEEL